MEGGADLADGGISGQWPRADGPNGDGVGNGGRRPTFPRASTAAVSSRGGVSSVELWKKKEGYFIRCKAL